MSDPVRAAAKELLDVMDALVPQPGNAPSSLPLAVNGLEAMEKLRKALDGSDVQLCDHRACKNLATYHVTGLTFGVHCCDEHLSEAQRITVADGFSATERLPVHDGPRDKPLCGRCAGVGRIVPRTGEPPTPEELASYTTMPCPDCFDPTTSDELYPVERWERERGLPTAYGGCRCECHTMPGVSHVVACCWEGYEDPLSADLGRPRPTMKAEPCSNDAEHAPHIVGYLGDVTVIWCKGAGELAWREGEPPPVYQDGEWKSAAETQRRLSRLTAHTFDDPVTLKPGDTLTMTETFTSGGHVPPHAGAHFKDLRITEGAGYEAPDDGPPCNGNCVPVTGPADARCPKHGNPEWSWERPDKPRCLAVWGASRPLPPNVPDDEHSATRCVSVVHPENTHCTWPKGVQRRYIEGEDVILVPDPLQQRWESPELRAFFARASS